MAFTYLDAFDDEPEALAELKAHYRRGGLGDAVIKKRLDGSLRTIAPIRARRSQFGGQARLYHGRASCGHRGSRQSHA